MNQICHLRWKECFDWGNMDVKTVIIFTKIIFY